MTSQIGQQRIILVDDIRLNHPAKVSTLGFRATLRHWMGRTLSTCGHFSYLLACLISRTNSIAKPIVEKANQKQEEIPIKGKITPQASPKLSDNLSPSQTSPKLSDDFSSDQASPLSPHKSDDILDPLDDAEESTSIVGTLLQTMGLQVSGKKLLQANKVYDMSTGKLMSKDIEKLNGYLQVEWHFTESELPAKLVYRGNLRHGVFHGEGSISTEEREDGAALILLDGTFQEGEFVSGMLVRDNCYIQGTFNKGKMNGQGTIHYEPSMVKDFKTGEDLLYIQEYRGSFVNGDPCGSGKIFQYSKEGVKLVGMGNFNAGRRISGSFQEPDGTIFQGKFNHQNDKEYFEGTVLNFSNHLKYEGECKNLQFHGEGKLETQFICNQTALVPSEGKDDELIITDIDLKVALKEVGVFKEHQLHQGDKTMIWEDYEGQEICAASKIQDGKIVETIVEMPDGVKYKGVFEQLPEKFDGEGTIYTSDGRKYYEGEIDCGRPHGKGKIFHEDGSFEEVEVEYGQLVGSEE